MPYIIIRPGQRGRGANLYCAGTFPSRRAAVRYVQGWVDKHGAKTRVRLARVVPDARLSIITKRS